MSLVAGMEIFHGYKLRQLLGKGAYGSVWEAAKDSGKPVALKFLPSADTKANRQEVKAIRMISGLVHPNLTSTYEVWSYKHYFVVAMELAEGSLLELLEAHESEYHMPVDSRDLCPLFCQAAAAIDFLNTRQHRVEDRLVAIQHCDIKPSNLLLFGDTLKLADFGLASITTQPMNFHRPVGTPAYMAPELIMGRLSDRCDQFSLAVSYVVMRTGKLPWPTEAPAGVPDRMVWPAPDLSKLQARERPIIARALSNMPQDRWPTCTAMMSQLNEMTQEMVIVRTPTPKHGLQPYDTPKPAPKP